MKPIKQASIFDRWLVYSTPAIRFYLSDLKELVRIAQAREMIVVIADDKHEFESVDELVTERGERVLDLTITASMSPHTLFRESEIKFRDAITVQTYKGEDRLALLHQDLVSFISGKRRWYVGLMRPTWWSMGIFGSFLPLYFADARASDFPFAVMIVCTEMMLIGWLYLSLNRGVYLRKAHEIQGFWSRNQDKIVSGLIGSALGAIVTRFFTH